MEKYWMQIKRRSHLVIDIDTYPRTLKICFSSGDLQVAFS